MKPLLILRLAGELFIKSEWTRKTFEKKLVENIKISLKNNSIAFQRIEKGRGRIFVHASEQELKKAVPVLQNVFGLNDLSLAVQSQFLDFDSLISVSFDFFKPLIKKNKSFAVQTSRTGNHSFKSIDINKKLGELIQKEFSLEVNLENPEQIVEIEIIDKRLFLIKESLPCIQGFPVGTAPPAALLLEGSENDLLSGLLMLSKGSKIFPIFNDKTKIPKNHLTPLEKFNNFNSFSPTSFSELKQLAEKEKLKAIALSDSKLKEENFLQELLVIKPLDFLPERKLLQLRELVFPLKKQS